MSQFDHTAYLEDVATSGKTLEGHKIIGIFHNIPSHMGNHIEGIEVFILRSGRFPVIRPLCL